MELGLFGIGALLTFHWTAPLGVFTADAALDGQNTSETASRGDVRRMTNGVDQLP